MVASESGRLATLLTRDVNFFVGAFLAFMDLASLLALASCARAFRSMLRHESVWRALHARDHMYVTPQERLSVLVATLIPSSFFAIGALSAAANRPTPHRAEIAARRATPEEPNAMVL